MYRTNLLTITTKDKRHFMQINGKYELRRVPLPEQCSS